MWYAKPLLMSRCSVSLTVDLRFPGSWRPTAATVSGVTHRCIWLGWEQSAINSCRFETAYPLSSSSPPTLNHSLENDLGDGVMTSYITYWRGCDDMLYDMLDRVWWHVTWHVGEGVVTGYMTCRRWFGCYMLHAMLERVYWHVRWHVGDGVVTCYMTCWRGCSDMFHDM